MKPVETITLPNGLTVEIMDASRSIAADTVKVELVVSAVIPLESTYFSDPEHCELVRKVHGAKMRYEYRAERTFVSTDRRGEVFGELVGNFKTHILPYVATPEFPRRFALSRLREILQHSYRYRHIIQ